MYKLLLTGILMAILSSPPGIASETNLLPGDTSFEAGPDQWKGGSSVVRNDAPFGRHVLELSETNNHSRIYYGLIKAGRNYTLSFNARCPGGRAKIKVSAWHVHYSAAAHPHTFKLNQKWQRYELPFKRQKLDRNIYFKVKLPENVKVELDGLMLSESPSAEFSPNPAPVIGQTPTGAPGNILLEKEPVPVIKIGAAAGKNAIQGKLTCRTVDFYGNTTQKSEWPVKLKTGESVSFSYPALKKNSRGYYLIKAELTDNAGRTIAKSSQPFGVAPEPGNVSLEKSFFGMHPAGDRVDQKALSNIGVKWLRIFYAWRYLERRAGKIKPIQGSSEGDFAILASLKLLKGAPKNQLRNNALINFKGMDKFLSELVKKSSPEVKAWEIENEPDLSYPSLLKRTYSKAAEYYSKLASPKWRGPLCCGYVWR